MDAELEYLTPQEAATLMRCSKIKLAKDRAKKQGLPWVKFGAKVLYSRADLNRFLDENRVRP